MITVKINNNERVYKLYKTNAIDRYDGFGTLELYSSSEIETNDVCRYILIDIKHSDWQLNRYRSGLYVTEPSDDIPATEIEKKFWTRIYEKECTDG